MLVRQPEERKCECRFIRPLWTADNDILFGPDKRSTFKASFEQHHDIAGDLYDTGVARRQRFYDEINNIVVVGASLIKQLYEGVL